MTTVAAVGVEGAALLAALHAGGIGVAGPAWDEAAFASLLALPGRTALVASDGEPAGFILLGQAADEAEIVTLAVSPAWRRRGIGRALVTAAAAHAGASGAARLFLEVAEDNAPALALYAALGFTPVGRRRSYYARHDGAADAIVMALPLSPSS